IPSTDIVTQDDGGTLQLEIKFIHPMEGDYMEMAKPVGFGVMHGGKKTDLLPALKKSSGSRAGQEGTFTFWKTDYQVHRPGDHVFFVTPQPYWEPAEDSFIVHYTKVCVNAFSLEAGWDDHLELETEIIPFTRPYGLWTGNLFTGQVLLKGRPVPFAQVEVEYLNESPGNPNFVIPPSDPYVAQVVKADENGVFSYAMPRAGWWGFAALNEADWTLSHDGQEKAVEIGAVIWVFTRDMK
ncbi:MAG: DUF4198 domain-containing protein, partial [Desulfotignum sp.]